MMYDVISYFDGDDDDDDDKNDDIDIKGRVS